MAYGQVLCLPVRNLKVLVIYTYTAVSVSEEGDNSPLLVGEEGGGTRPKGALGCVAGERSEVDSK